MPFWKSKKESEKGGGKKLETTEVKKSGNNMSNNNIQESRRLTYSFSTSSSSYTSESVQKSSLSTTNSTPNLPMFSSSTPLTKLPPIQAQKSMFETDARPLQSTTLTPNYQSPFGRNRLTYNSAREPSTSFVSTNRTALSPLPRYQSPSQVSTTIIRPPATGLAAPTRSTINNNITGSIVPTYAMAGTKRGYVIVINNINFIEEKDFRKGAEKDEKDILKLFTDMGFEVKVHRNLKVSEMTSKIQSFRRDSKLSKGDISIVVMMSHGTNQNNNQQIVPGNFTQILGSDGKFLPIEEVLAEFSTDNCPSMKGKPKIFIFQCCRGDQYESLHVDAVPIKNAVKQHADMLIAFSTLPGFYSIRDTQKGSWYIQSICDVFRKHAKSFDVESLLKIVDDQLSKKHPQHVQTSNYESRGFKKCFLVPQINSS